MLLSLPSLYVWLVDNCLSVAGKLIYIERDIWFSGRLVVSDPRAERDNTLRQIEWLAGYHAAGVETRDSQNRLNIYIYFLLRLLTLSWQKIYFPTESQLIYNLIDIDCHKSRVRHTSYVTRGILNYQTRQCWYIHVIPTAGKYEEILLNTVAVVLVVLVVRFAPNIEIISDLSS